MSFFLSVVLAAEFCVAGFKYPGFLKKEGGGFNLSGILGEGTSDGNDSDHPSGQSVSDSMIDFLSMTDEELETYAANQVEPTVENSPGNPSFIDVSFTEAEYSAAKTLTASVSTENPSADFPEFGIHVDLKSWNLENETDILTVKQMPAKTDSVTGCQFYTYDFSLASGQNRFLTAVEVTAPVQGGAENFYGVVLMNEETGKWEDAYCELSADGKSYTAYMPHFSLQSSQSAQNDEKSAIDTIREDGAAAIRTYQNNGKSIFVQLDTEMKEKYKGTYHYLYPVTVLKTTDLGDYLEKPRQDILTVIESIIRTKAVPKDSALTEGIDALGTVSDTVSAGNSLTNNLIVDALANADKAGETLGTSLTFLGILMLGIRIYDQVQRGVDTETIIKDNTVGAVSSIIGFSSFMLQRGVFLKFFGAFAGASATVLSVVGAGLFLYIYSSTKMEEIMDDTYPLGAPSSMQEAAYHCYLRDNAKSDNGYVKTSWFTEKLAVPEGTSLADVYRNHPEKVLDAKGNGWMNGLKELTDTYENDPQELGNAVMEMYESFVSSYWNESYEVRKQYFRTACKRYVTLRFNKLQYDSAPCYAECSSVDYYCYYLKSNGSTSAEKEFERLGQLLLTTAQNNPRIAGTDKLWDIIFREWDQNPNREKRIIEGTWTEDDFNPPPLYMDEFSDNSFLSTLDLEEKQKNEESMRENALTLIKSRTNTIVNEFWQEKYRDAVMEVKDRIYNKILPLLNARLTFYAKDSSAEGVIFKTSKVYQSFYSSEAPEYEFEFDGDDTPLFKPANAADVADFGYHLDLIPNKENTVLLETTVYHYLMFGCPEDVTITGLKNGSVVDRIEAHADWNGVTLNTDPNSTSDTLTSDLPENIIDTTIPIVFGAGKTTQKTGLAAFEGRWECEGQYTGDQYTNGTWKVEIIVSESNSVTTRVTFRPEGEKNGHFMEAELEYKVEGEDYWFENGVLTIPKGRSNWTKENWVFKFSLSEGKMTFKYREKFYNDETHRDEYMESTFTLVKTKDFDF